MEPVTIRRYTPRSHHRYKNVKFANRDQICDQHIFLSANTVVPRPWDAVAVAMNLVWSPDIEEAVSPWPLLITYTIWVSA